jgi:hypothetical protein
LVGVIAVFAGGLGHPNDVLGGIALYVLPGLLKS